MISDPHAASSCLAPLLPRAPTSDAGCTSPATCSLASPRPRRKVAAAFRTIFAQTPTEIAALGPDPRHVRRQVPQARPAHGHAKAEVLAFTAFPRDHWRRLVQQPARAAQQGDQTPLTTSCRSSPTTPPSSASSARSSPSMHDDWRATHRHYLSEASMAKLYTARDTQHIAELTPGDWTPRITSKSTTPRGAHRLLVSLTHVRCLARLGRGVRDCRSHIGCPLFAVWLSHGLRGPRRRWAGVAQEGIALL